VTSGDVISLMFDTHCHLNFKRFKDNIKDVVDRAIKAGVTGIIVPGTDIHTSKVSVELSNQYEGVYSAVGIHPHHVFSVIPNLFRDLNKKMLKPVQHDKNLDVKELEKLLIHPKVVAVGEVGLDKFQYTNTKYQTYQINTEFIEAQKQLLVEQIKLALKYDKSLIIHNREAKSDLLPLLEKNWDKKLKGKTVFHCCEPDLELLEFAQKYDIFIGVDGDITYGIEKAEFIKKVPLEMLVVETDSPYLLPEPLRKKKEYPNEPKNIPLVIEAISTLRKCSFEKVERIVSVNALQLFQLPEYKGSHDSKHNTSLIGFHIPSKNTT